MTYKFTLDEIEGGIHTLAEQYPKCFFAEPKLRRPLKENIVADLEKDGAPIATEMLDAVVKWYMSHFSYQYHLKAGEKRIDLNGKEVGTVTEPEQRTAQIKIAEDKEKQKRKNERIGYDYSVRSTTALVEAGRIANDQFRKIDAPPATKIEAPMSRAAAKTLPICPELLPVYDALVMASAAMPTLAGNTDMQPALLGVVSTKLEHVIRGLAQNKDEC